MTLQERQKREIERLNNEIKILIETGRILDSDIHREEIMSRDLSLSYVTHAPEKYFENIDEEE